eukprot:12862126-Heterocapsa_arctica.AAC.1
MGQDIRGVARRGQLSPNPLQDLVVGGGPVVREGQQEDVSVLSHCRDRIGFIQLQGMRPEDPLEQEVA